MKKAKLFLPLSIALFTGSFAYFANCTSDNAIADKGAIPDSVSLAILPVGEIQAGEVDTIQGIIAASKTPNVVCAILDSLYQPIADSTPVVILSQPATSLVNISEQMKMRIKTHLETCNRRYYLLITSAAGIAVSIDTIPFRIVGGRLCNGGIESVEITVSSIDSIRAGAMVQIAGTINGTSVVSAAYSVLDSMDSTVKDGKIQVIADLVAGRYAIDLADDAQLAIFASSSACNGKYRLKIIAQTGTASTVKTIPFSVYAGLNCVPVNNDRADITIGYNTDTISAGQSLAISGEVVGSSEPDITYSLEALSTANINGVSFTAVQVSGKKTVNLESDAALTIITSAAACNGTYILIISATSGSASATKRFSFTVTGGQSCTLASDTILTSGVVTLGAQASPTGSSLDADAMIVYVISQVNSSVLLQASIDVFFSHSAIDNLPKLYSPYAAGINGFSSMNWTTQNATMFVKAPQGTSIDSLDSLSKVRAIYNEGTPADRVPIAQGDVVVVMTNQNYPVALGIQSITGTTTSATISVKGYHR